MIFKIFEFECWLCLSPLRSKHLEKNFALSGLKSLYIYMAISELNKGTWTPVGLWKGSLLHMKENISWGNKGIWLPWFLMCQD